jgi:hypothetical protein
MHGDDAMYGTDFSAACARRTGAATARKIESFARRPDRTAGRMAACSVSQTSVEVNIFYFFNEI